jgi:DedD protein
MRMNSKLAERFELSLDGRQVVVIVGAALVIVGGAFVLGMSYGSRSAAPAATAAPKDPLATLDEPLTASPKEDDALRAHEALTAAHPEALPAPAVKAVAAVPATPTANPSATANPTATAIPTATAAATPTANPNPNPNPNPTATTTTSPPPVAAFAEATPERDAPKALPHRKTAKPERSSTRERAATSHRGSYTIQVASVAHRAEAEKIAKRFAGRSSRVVAADVPGKGRVWRVQVGLYPTRDAASRSLATLGGSGFVTAAR